MRVIVSSLKNMLFYIILFLFPYEWKAYGIVSLCVLVSASPLEPSGQFVWNLEGELYILIFCHQ
jgi:hypothetical protein